MISPSKPPRTTLALRSEDCEVFLYATTYNGYECVTCSLEQERCFKHLASGRDLMEHVIAHREAGHLIPDGLITKVIRERENEMRRELRFENIRATEAAMIDSKKHALKQAGRSRFVVPQYPGLQHKDLMRT